jgi:hypothetical protein
MPDRYRHIGLVSALLLALVACSGGGSGGSSTPVGPGGGNPPPPPSQTGEMKKALGAADAFGSRAKVLSTDAFVELHRAAGQIRPAKHSSNCVDGVEFFMPDRNGDPDSNEALYFYNSHCTQLAVDVVNLVTSTGKHRETVNTTARSYAHGHADTPTAMTTATSKIFKATFDSNGFPIVADGFNRSTNSELSLGTTPTIANDDEMVLKPSSTNVSDFCSDFAGYDVAGIPSLGATFGWQGGAFSGGTRKTNADGSVTWNAPTTGNVVQGGIGSLSIDKDRRNTTCPISSPQFTIVGGTSLGKVDIPLAASLENGRISDISVSGATLPNGDTLDVTTNTHKFPGNPNFITGTISDGRGQVAKFGLDAFGNGQLIIMGHGNFKIVDWMVVQ